MTENARTVKAFVERQPFVSAVLVTGMTLGALTTVLTFVDKYRPWPSHSELQKLHKERVAGDRIAYDTAISYWTDRHLQLRVHLGEAKRDNDKATARLVERDLVKVNEKLENLKRGLRGLQ